MTDAVQIRRLLAAAAEVRASAYAPYSQFQVGAAVLAADGRMFRGCNVENASYGLTICAERTAAGAAVVEGGLPLTAVAVVAQGAPAPCGACRQFLAELGPDAEVYAADPRDLDRWRRFALAELLPERFGPKDVAARGGAGPGSPENPLAKAQSRGEDR